MFASAFVKNGAETRFVIAFLDQKIKPGDVVPVIDFEEVGVGTDIVPVTSFFATRGRRYMNFGTGTEGLDIDYMKAASNFFATRDGDYMDSITGISDLRLVGDTTCTVVHEGDKLVALKNLVLLGYATRKHVLIAKPLTGSLMIQSIAKLDKANVDDVSAWQPIQGLDHVDDIFRMSRVVVDGNDLVAPVTAQRGGTPQNGEIVINLASNHAQVDYNDDDEFPITAARIGDDKPATAMRDRNRDPLGLITYGGEQGGLGMKPIDVSTKGPYQRYAQAMQQAASA